jgi:integrase
MAPKKRDAKHKGLPKYWRTRTNKQGITYYTYRVPPIARHLHGGKQEISLGKSLASAYKKFAEFRDSDECVTTLGSMLDRYLMEVVPEYKSENTRDSKIRSIQRLRASIGDNLLTTVDATLIKRYKKRIGDTRSKVQANRDLECLSHMFSTAIDWGILQHHPMLNKQVKKYKTRGRTRYVEDWELEQWAKTANPFLVVYVKLKGATGLRQQDLLMLQKKDISDTEIIVTPLKTDRDDQELPKILRFQLYDKQGNSSSIKLALDEVDAYYRDKAMRKIKCRTPGRLPPVINSRWVFTTRTGGSYYNIERRRAPGFKNIWGRSMKKALELTDLEDRFTEHDLRGKVGSDFDTDQEAQNQLGHSDPKTTRKHYRRKGSVVQAAKGFLREVDSDSK